MSLGTIIIIIVAAVVILLAFYVIGTYNNLVNARNKVNDQFAQIDVQLKRRSDMIPNLVETVKGYAKHEEKTLTEVIEARNKAVSATTINDKVEANNQLTGALNKLFALSESYPELKANENFLQLSEELRNTENKISFSRQFYNDSVTMYNTKLQVFPSNIIAGMFNFTARDLFKTDDEARKNVKVDFGK